MASARSRKLRWSAPLLVAAVIAMIAAIPGLSAAASPSLAPLSPQELLVKVHQANVTALSGTLNLSTNLGIPNLGALSDAAGGGRHGASGFSPTDLLSGTHTALVWFAGPDASRVALLQDMAETDVIHNGQNVWTWDSTSKKVVHYTVAPGTGAPHTNAKAADSATPSPAEAVKTPQQMAADLLSHLDPTTAVSTSAAVTVAHQKAYQLILTPKTAATTVDHVAIAVDSVTGLPLEVQIFAKGQKASAIKVGFSKIDYATPAASHFAFTAPPGATVTNKTLGGSHPAATTKTDPTKTEPAATSQQETTVGQGWSTVTVLHNVQVPKQFNQYLTAATSVTGSFGSGKLLETSLVKILVLPDGRVAVGAVNASTLEAAIASAP